MKLLQFASLIVTRPSEAYGRLEGLVDSRVDPFRVKSVRYQSKDFEEAIAGLSSALGRDLCALLSEPGLCEIEDEILRGIERLPKDAPFGLFQNGDMNLARLCYVLARVLRPQTVLETGVCYGVTTSFLLQALQVNGSGNLHSIDLPPLGDHALDFVGRLVPERLRNIWSLHRGVSRILQPRLLKQLRRVDLFVHDSLHTYRNILRELNMVTPVLPPVAAVLADDIEGNPAFANWTSRVHPTYCGVVHESSKNSLLGVALFLSQS
jgi:hypothetical protein